MRTEPAGLLLAAGRGVRFDPGGRALKLLTAARRGPHVGAPLAAAAARTLSAELPRVVAVVRPADSDAQRQLHDLLRNEGCALAVCDNANAGISASIACGVRASSDAGGWIIALADMPAVAASTVRAVADALVSGDATAAPMYQGQRGHPVGFAAHLRDELLALTGDTGARTVLTAHPPRLFEVDDPGVLYDVDYLEQG
jgi:molybdenum cofactor cytidylyltransferase